MQKGFTLIEFLVTIAIIGILSVVLASLGNARGKARIQCVKDHNTSYCAEQAGISRQKFEKMLESDKENLKNNDPCKINE